MDQSTASPAGLTEEDLLIVNIQGLLAGYMKNRFEKALTESPPPAVDIVMFESGKKVGQAIINSLIGSETKHKALSIDNEYFRKGSALSILSSLTEYVKDPK